MISRKTKPSPCSPMLTGLMLICALFLSACDGGIFGTGGSDDMLLPGDIDGAPPNATGSNSENMEADAEPVTANPQTTGDTAGADGMTAGTGAIQSTAGDTSGATAGTATGGTDGVLTGTAGDTAGDTVGNTVGDTAGDTAGNDDGTTGAQAPSETSDGGSDNGHKTVDQFSNTVVTLNTEIPLVSLFNSTAINLNMFETSVEPDSLLFEPAGVAPGALSPATELINNATSLTIVDTSNVAESLVTYTSFVAMPSTLTNIVVRQVDGQISVVTLVTETSTSDPMLAKVRVVQAGTLGNEDAIINAQLLSVGPNGGGLDTSFTALSFSNPQTDYVEMAAGQYELVDESNNFTPQQFTLAGGTVYTMLLTGSGTNSVTLINDSEMGQP